MTKRIIPIFVFMTWMFAGIAVIVLLVFWLIFYNRLVRLSILVDEAWSGIDVQLRRRTDVIPKLENCLERYMSHEKATLLGLTKMRAEQKLDTSKPEALEVAKDEALGLNKLNILVEDYPDLKSDELFTKLIQQISTIESDLQHARRYYNGTVKNHNNAVEQFPSNLVAGLHNYRPEPFFDIDPPELPKIDL